MLGAVYLNLEVGLFRQKYPVSISTFHVSVDIFYFIFK